MSRHRLVLTSVCYLGFQASGGSRRPISSPPDLLTGQGSAQRGPASSPAVPGPTQPSPPDPPGPLTAPAEAAAEPGRPADPAAAAARPDQLLLTVRQLRMKLQREMEAKSVLQEEVSGLKRRAEQKAGGLTPGGAAADQSDRSRPASSPETPPRSPHLPQTTPPVTARPTPSAAAAGPTPPAGSVPGSPAGPNPRLQRLTEDVRRLTEQRDGAAAQAARLQREAHTARQERDRLRRGLHEARAELTALNGERQRRQAETRERAALLVRAREETDALRAEREELRAELAARDVRIAGLVRDLADLGPPAEDRSVCADPHLAGTDGGGVPQTQWSWAEDAGWPAGDQSASEALRLGGEQLRRPSDNVLASAPSQPSTEKSSDSLTATVRDDVDVSRSQQTQQLKEAEEEDVEEKEEQDAPLENTTSPRSAFAHQAGFLSDSDSEDDLDASRHDTTPRAALWSGVCHRRHLHRRTPLQHIPEQEEPPSDWESDSTDSSDGSDGSAGGSGGDGGAASARAEVVRLQETVSRLESERDAAAERAAELDETVTRLDVELTAVFVECESERRRAAEADRQAEALLQERAAARERRQSAEEAVVELRAELEEARAERRRLADRLESVTAENGELLRRLETNRQRLDELTQTAAPAPTQPRTPAVTVGPLESRLAVQQSTDHLSAPPPSRSVSSNPDEAQLSTLAPVTPWRPAVPSQRLSDTPADSDRPLLSLLAASDENQGTSPAMEALFSQVISNAATGEADLTPAMSPPLEGAVSDCASETSQSEDVRGGNFQLTESLSAPAALACASSATCDSGVDVLDQDLDPADHMDHTDHTDHTNHTDSGFSDPGPADGGRLLSVDLARPPVTPPFSGRRRLLLSDYEPAELDTASLSCPELGVLQSPSLTGPALDARDSVRGEVRRHLRAAVAATGGSAPLSATPRSPFCPPSPLWSEPSKLPGSPATRSPCTPESASQRIARYTELEARRLVDESQRLRREVEELRAGLLAERGWVEERELLAAQRENAALLGRLEELTVGQTENQRRREDECVRLKARLEQLEASQTENETLTAELDGSPRNVKIAQAEETEFGVSKHNTDAMDACETDVHASEGKRTSGSQLLTLASEHPHGSNERPTDPVEAVPAPDSELWRRVETAEQARTEATAELESARAELAETRTQLQQWVEYCHYWLGSGQLGEGSDQAASDQAAPEGPVTGTEVTPDGPVTGTEAVAQTGGSADGETTEKAEAPTHDSEMSPIINGAHSWGAEVEQTAEPRIPSSETEQTDRIPSPETGQTDRIPSTETEQTDRMPSVAGVEDCPAVGLPLFRAFSGQTAVTPPLLTATGEPQPFPAESALLDSPGADNGKLTTSHRIQVNRCRV